MDCVQYGTDSSCDKCDNLSADVKYSLDDDCNDSYRDLDNKSCLPQAETECASYWLKQAIMMHYMHIKNPSTETKESQMEMMRYMFKACECMTGENMTLDMMNKTVCDGSEGWMNATKYDESHKWMNALVDNESTCDKSSYEGSVYDKSQDNKSTEYNKSLNLLSN